MPPYTCAFYWPLQDNEPHLRFEIPAGIPRSWVERYAPAFASVNRFGLGLGSASPGLMLEATGDAFLPVQQRAIEWPMSTVVGSEIRLIRRQVSGTTETGTGIILSRTGVVVGDSDGNAAPGTHARSDEPIRIWTLNELVAIPPGARSLSTHAFEITGQLGERIVFQTQQEKLQLAFASQPLALQPRGPRWRSHDPRGPYIGVPRIEAKGVSALEVCLPGGRRTPLRHHGGVFDLTLEDAPRSGGLRFRSGGKEAVLRLDILPSGTRHRLEPPARDGSRLLLVSSPRLAELRLRRAEHDAVIATVDARGQGEIRLKLPPTEHRQDYAVELVYLDSPAGIFVPVVDVRRHFDLIVGDRVFALGAERERGPTMQRSLARLATVRGVGVEPGTLVSVMVRSAGRWRSGAQHPSFDGWAADRSGEVELPLQDLIDDLEPCTTHELIVNVAGALTSRFHFTVTDSHFLREPCHDGPYTELLPGCALTGALEWRWVAAAQPWDGWRAAPMIETDGGWVPPAVDAPPGGILAAPFDSTRRVGQVRFLEDLSGREVLDELGRRLIAPDGLSVTALRAELAASPARRDRLRAMIETLAMFGAGDALEPTRLARLDGALPAWLAMRSDAGLPAGFQLDTLRAIPIGAWWRAVAAAQDDSGPLPALTVPEGPLLLVALLRAGLPGAGEHRQQIADAAARFASCRPLRSATRGEAGAGPVTLADFCERLIVLLEDWRRGDRTALHDLTIAPSLRRRLDGEAIRDNVHPDVLALLGTHSPEVHRFFLAPLALGALAARVVLDPRLTPAARGELRAELLEPRQLRAWRRCEPLVGALYLYSLCRHWSDLCSACGSGDALREVIAAMEVA